MEGHRGFFFNSYYTCITLKTLARLRSAHSLCCGNVMEEDQPRLSVPDAHECNEYAWRVQAQLAHPNKHLVPINCHYFAKTASHSFFRVEVKTSIVYFVCEPPGVMLEKLLMNYSRRQQQVQLNA